MTPPKKTHLFLSRRLAISKRFMQHVETSLFSCKITVCSLRGKDIFGENLCNVLLRPVERPSFVTLRVFCSQRIFPSTDGNPRNPAHSTTSGALFFFFKFGFEFLKIFWVSKSVSAFLRNNLALGRCFLEKGFCTLRNCCSEGFWNCPPSPASHIVTRSDKGYGEIVTDGCISLHVLTAIRAEVKVLTRWTGHSRTLRWLGRGGQEHWPVPSLPLPVLLLSLRL